LPDDISVRLLRESDLAAYKAIRLEALRDHPEAYGTDHGEELLQPEAVWVNRIRDAVDSPKGCIALAEAGTEVVGIAGVRRDHGIKGSHAALIWGVYVRPKYRGKRVAVQMIHQLLDWCRSNQVRIVRLSATNTGRAAVQCYLRAGFTIYGVSPEEIRIGERYYDELLMWRRV
jgi:GNAT superfamily N-acetyltransferase